MSYAIQRGVFIGVDDTLSFNETTSTMQGSLSAAVLHAEFGCRSSQGEWELVIPNDSSQISRSYLLRKLVDALTQKPKTAPMLIYFGGHGCSFQGKYIFCPQDFNQTVPDASGVTLELLTSLVQRFSSARRKLVIVFDTCRNSLDAVSEVGEAVPPNCTIVYTAEYGNPTIEIDGYSDFVRGFLQCMRGASRSSTSRITSLDLAEAIQDIQTSRPPKGSGRQLHLTVIGPIIKEAHFLVDSGPDIEERRTIECRLISRPKPPGECGRFRGEMLNKIAHFTGIPMDPAIVQISEIGTSGAETIRIALPLTRSIKNARVLDYVIREWSYLFTDLELLIPSPTIAKGLSRLLRTYEFDVWSSDEKTIAIKKLSSVAARVEYSAAGRQGLQVCLSCLGEDEKRGLERLDDLFFPLVRDLIEIGLSA